MKFLKNVFFILLSILVSGCGGGGGATNTTPAPSPAPTPAAIVITDVVTYADTTHEQSPNFEFAKLGSATGNCIVNQSLPRDPTTSEALTSLPDARLYVVCQQGNGTFKEVSQELFGQTISISGSYPLIADFNNDGVDDIFLVQSWDGPAVDSSFYTRTIYALVSKPDGTYSVNNVPIPTNYYGQNQLTAFDVNQDGCLDVVSSGSVWLGNCGAVFTTASITSTNFVPGGAGNCSGDFVGNGHKQWVVTDYYDVTHLNAIYEVDSSLAITAIHDLPTPYFETAYSQPHSSHSYKCETADINNDGKLDLIVYTSNWFAPAGHVPSSLPQIYLNKGNWVFEDITATALAGYNKTFGATYNARVVDLNGDGYLDLAFDQPSWDRSNGAESQVWINNKDNTFTKYFSTQLTNLYDQYRKQNNSTTTNPYLFMLPVKNGTAWDYMVFLKTNSPITFRIGIAKTQYDFR